MHTKHTRLTALSPGLPRWAGTRKDKPIWILLKQETVSGSGISWNICKSAPHPREITMPAPHHSVFLQAGCPSCSPTNSVKALKAFKALKALNASCISVEWKTNKQCRGDIYLGQDAVTHRPLTDISKSNPKLNPVHRQQYYNSTTTPGSPILLTVMGTISRYSVLKTECNNCRME